MLVLFGPSRARRLQRPREPASRASGRVGLGAQRRPEARRHRLRQCEEGHEWSGLIASRARKGEADPGCPYCSGRKVPAGYNDLATTHPSIAAMWHPRMNKRLKPTGVQATSRKPAWWRGECGRVYQIVSVKAKLNTVA